MLRSADKWLAGYLKSVWRRPPLPGGLKHLVFCVADHFEPFRAGVPRDQALHCVERWAAEYPALAQGLTDGDGKTPRHTFFCAAEEYDPGCIEALSRLCRAGHGEIEIHLHHRGDTADGLREKLTRYRDILRREHGLLGTDRDGAIRYGFVHGNWALCNSLPDGDWCGVNEELGVLADTGCYADFTFPSAPSPTQPRTVNTIYRARDIPGKPRSHDRGVPVVAKRITGNGLLVTDYRSPITAHSLLGGCGSPGGSPSHTPTPPHSHTPALPHSALPHSAFRIPHSLLLLPGPLGLNWRQRKCCVLPRLENAEITGRNPPTPARIDLWVRQHIHVRGRPEWVFVKVHTHGAVDGNAKLFLDRAPCAGDTNGPNPRILESSNLPCSVRGAYEYLRRHYNDGSNWKQHWVSAREMYNLVRAAEDGAEGDPGEYRDYEVGKGEGGGGGGSEW